MEPTFDANKFQYFVYLATSPLFNAVKIGNQKGSPRELWIEYAALYGMDTVINVFVKDSGYLSEFWEGLGKKISKTFVDRNLGPPQLFRKEEGDLATYRAYIIHIVPGAKEYSLSKIDVEKKEFYGLDKWHAYPDFSKGWVSCFKKYDHTFRFSTKSIP